jgi:hypothetical protein
MIESPITPESLALFERSPALYHATYVAKTAEPPRDIFSEACKIKMLAFDRWFSLYRVVEPLTPIQQPAKKGKKGDVLERLQAPADDGRDAIERFEVEQIDTMAAHVKSHPELQRMLSAAEVLAAYTWESDGLAYSCQIDAVGRSGTLLNFRVVPDARPEPVTDMLYREGWYRQAAFEALGHQSNAKMLEAYMVVAVSVDEVALYRMPSELLGRGAIENAKLILRMVECDRQGQWRAPWSCGFNEIPIRT